MSAKPKNEARELAVEVLKFLDLKAEAERGRDSAGGLARVRQAEHELRKLCRLFATDDRPTANLFQ